MTNLKIFNETNNIYPGVNTPQFSQLEQLADITNTSGCQLLNLGLFGEASTGKTTSVEILAKATHEKLANKSIEPAYVKPIYFDDIQS